MDTLCIFWRLRNSNNSRRRWLGVHYVFVVHHTLHARLVGRNAWLCRESSGRHCLDRLGARLGRFNCLFKRHRHLLCVCRFSHRFWLSKSLCNVPVFPRSFCSRFLFEFILAVLRIDCFGFARLLWTFELCNGGFRLFARHERGWLLWFIRRLLTCHLWLSLRLLGLLRR